MRRVCVAMAIIVPPRPFRRGFISRVWRALAWRTSTLVRG
jgi:hypothetical protein